MACYSSTILQHATGGDLPLDTSYGYLQRCLTHDGSGNFTCNMNLLYTTAGTDRQFNWTMNLVRELNGSSSVIASRSGYIKPSSSSSRTFTDVVSRGGNIYVTVLIADTTSGAPTQLFDTPKIAW